MMDRCYKEGNSQFRRYGGRGIIVEPYLQDVTNYMGYVRSLPGCPKDGKKTHLDRIDNNRSYERGNLRWVDCKTNSRNSTSMTEVNVNGEVLSVAEFVKKYTYLSYNYVGHRLREGASPETLIRTPPGCKSPYYRNFRLGELRPKHPFSEQEWIDSP